MSEDLENIQAKLCAYLEGDLGPAERAEIEQHLARNPQDRRLMAELTRTRQLVRRLPRASVPAEVAEAIQRQLERSALLDGEAGTPAPSLLLRVSRWPQLAAAAILLLVVGLGAVVYYVVLPHGTADRPTAVAFSEKPLPDVVRGLSGARAAKEAREEKDKATAASLAKQGAAVDRAKTALANGASATADQESAPDVALKPGMDRAAKAESLAWQEARLLAARGAGAASPVGQPAARPERAQDEALAPRPVGAASPADAGGLLPNAALKQLSQDQASNRAILVVSTNSPTFANSQVEQYLTRNNIAFDVVPALAGGRAYEYEVNARSLPTERLALKGGQEQTRNAAAAAPQAPQPIDPQLQTQANRADAEPQQFEYQHQAQLQTEPVQQQVQQDAPAQQAPVPLQDARLGTAGQSGKNVLVARRMRLSQAAELRDVLVRPQGAVRTEAYLQGGQAEARQLSEVAAGRPVAKQGAPVAPIAPQAAPGGLAGNAGVLSDQPTTAPAPGVATAGDQSLIREGDLLSVAASGPGLQEMVRVQVGVVGPDGMLQLGQNRFRAAGQPFAQVERAIADRYRQETRIADAKVSISRIGSAGVVPPLFGVPATQPGQGAKLDQVQGPAATPVTTSAPPAASPPARAAGQAAQAEDEPLDVVIVVQNQETAGRAAKANLQPSTATSRPSPAAEPRP